MPRRTSFHILELSLFSAKELTAVSKSMRTFAVAWVNPERKLTTRVDQEGHTDPNWNEKFVFRVDSEFLENPNSTVTIEIYSSTLLRDALVGTVSELVSNLIPTSQPRDKSTMHFFTLQVRRPSGRPKGILNVGVTLLDSSKRSLPLESELSSSAMDYDWDMMDIMKLQKHQLVPNANANANAKDEKNKNKFFLKRSQSERFDPDAIIVKPSGSICNASSIIGGNESVRSKSEIGGTKKILNGNGSLCSDVGPSPSVVAAAIAKGLYQTGDDVGSSILEDWTEQDSIEGLKTKIERWKTELPPVYDNEMGRLTQSRSYGRLKEKKQRRRSGGLFSCFGTAYGCEFSISCGGPHHKKKFGNGKSKTHLTPSELTYEESYV